MKVKFTQSCAGIDFSFAAHSVHDLPAAAAAAFVRAGLATPVEEVRDATLPDEGVERAVAPASKKSRR
jgi:hypothetical protein